jgi:multidrug efflux system membrane fusion protein
MADPTQNQVPKSAAILLSAGIVVAAALSGACVLWEVVTSPRTDDAEVFANFIGIAPVVSGPVTSLPIVDNQFIKAGEPLFEIDDRPYRYALAQAESELASLVGQIENQRRTIASLNSGVDVAKSAASSSEAGLNRAFASVEQAKADVANAKAAVDKADAESTYASNNFRRLEPLLQEQFVTVDQVDQARTAVSTRGQAAKQARSQAVLAEAGLLAAEAQYRQAQATLTQSRNQILQAAHNVTTLAPLLGQLPGKRAAIDTAKYNFDHCRVVAPFDARVTNLTISQGVYAHAGEQVFTLIDTRVWWVIANFRETQLQHIRQGMQAEIYLLSRPNVRFKGFVDSTGFGVTPDADLIGKLTPGLPDVQRTLNWVHLASRFPVRVRVLAPEHEAFRLGESAVVVIRGGTEAASVASARR